MSVSCSRYRRSSRHVRLEKDPRFHSYKAVLLKWLDAHSGKKH